MRSQDKARFEKMTKEDNEVKPKDDDKPIALQPKQPKTAYIFFF